MHRRLFVASALIVFGVAALSSVHQASGQGAGWVTLFDGKNLDNWTIVGNANWRLDDGAAVADKGNGFLLSKTTYKDFQLRAEFWYSEDANSGIYVRCTNDTKIDSSTAYEVNLWDTRPEKNYATGAVVNVAPVDPMPKAAGKWGTYDITLKGGTFTVILNGQTTVNGVSDTKYNFASGKIALQHGLGLKDANGVASDKGVVKFRKVEIKPL